jgi:thiol-disulfide isomerase/thioredoxin
MLRNWVAKIAIVGLAALTMGACTKRSASSAGSADDVAELHAPGGHPLEIKLFRNPAPLPAFDLTTLDGRHITSDDLKGKVVLMNFWATWCPPCRAEIPDLMELQSRYRDKLVIIGVSEDDPPIDTVTKFVADEKMNYPVAMSTDALRKIFRGVVALPTTFVIDPDGRLEQKHVGQLNAANTEGEARALAGMKVDVAVERVEDSDKVRLENAAQAKNIPGVDLSHLSDAQHKAVAQALISEDCTCGCGLSVAECRLEDPTCSISLPLAQDIVKKYSAQP